MFVKTTYLLVFIVISFKDIKINNNISLKVFKNNKYYFIANFNDNWFNKICLYVLN